MDGIDRFADAAVTEFLARQAPSAATWDGPECEGATGSTYCSWTSSDSTVSLRVANEAASVVAVRLGPPPGGVAVWPYTTLEEARDIQQGVDQGHMPWQLNPEGVAASYARATLGVDQPEFEQTTSEPVTMRLIDAGGGVIDLRLAQPERTGNDGIWAIVEVDAHGVGT